MKRAYVSMVAVLLFVFGQAGARADATNSLPSPTDSTEAPASTPFFDQPGEPRPVTPQNALTEHQLPKLLLRWDCGTCVHNPKVLPLIEQDYARDAAAGGYTVSDSETAELVITAYRQRNPGVRWMVGIMAGPDILTTHVTFRGKEFVASDYSADVLHGMNSLCAAVSKKAIEQLLSARRD